MVRTATTKNPDVAVNIRAQVKNVENADTAIILGRSKNADVASFGLAALTKNEDVATAVNKKRVYSKNVHS